MLQEYINPVSLTIIDQASAKSIRNLMEYGTFLSTTILVRYVLNLSSIRKKDGVK